MPEINELPPIAPSDVSDDDLIVLWDAAAPSGSNAKQSTRAQFLAGVTREDQDATLAVVDADELNAPLGAIDTITVASALVMGATLSKMVYASASVTVATLASLATETQTKTVTGALVGDIVILQPPHGLPVGLLLSGAVAATDTVQIHAVNATVASIPGATYSVAALLMRMV